MGDPFFCSNCFLGPVLGKGTFTGEGSSAFLEVWEMWATLESKRRRQKSRVTFCSPVNMESGAGKKQLKDTFIFVNPSHFSLSLSFLIPSACFPWVIKIKRACLDERKPQGWEVAVLKSMGNTLSVWDPLWQGGRGRKPQQEARPSSSFSWRFGDLCYTPVNIYIKKIDKLYQMGVRPLCVIQEDTFTFLGGRWGKNEGHREVR